MKSKGSNNRKKQKVSNSTNGSHGQDHNNHQSQSQNANSQHHSNQHYHQTHGHHSGQSMKTQSQIMLEEIEKNKRKYQEMVLRQKQQWQQQMMQGGNKGELPQMNKEQFDYDLIDQYEDYDGYYEDEYYDEQQQDESQINHQRANGQQEMEDDTINIQDILVQCTYKIFLGLILLGCIVFIYVLYSMLSPSIESNLKVQIMRAVKSKQTQPQFYETQIFPQSIYQDYPFKLFSYQDKNIASYLQQTISQQYCYQFLDQEKGFACQNCENDHNRVKSKKESKKFTKGTLYKVPQKADQGENSDKNEDLEYIQSNQLESGTEHGESSYYSSFQQHFQSEIQERECYIKNEFFFNETHIPILFVHGHGKGNPQQINSLNQQLQKLLIYENEKNLQQHKYSQNQGKYKLKQFKIYAMDFKNALSAFSVSLIEKEQQSVKRTIEYIQTRTSEKLILVCHSMGGLVCLNVISLMSEEQLVKIQQVIFLNSPLTQHPLNSNSAFVNKYKQLYRLVHDRKHLLQYMTMLSFTSGSSDNQVIPEETHIKQLLKNTAYFRTQDLRDVFVTLGHDEILTYTPFLSLLAKYLVMDRIHNTFLGDINTIKHFFTQFDIHYEDQIHRNYFAFNKEDLDTQCGTVVPKFEQSSNIDLLQAGNKLKFREKSLPSDYSSHPRSYLNKENLLCVKINTQNIKASNLIYYMRTNIPSQNIKLLTFKQRNSLKYKLDESTRSAFEQMEEEYITFDSENNLPEWSSTQEKLDKQINSDSSSVKQNQGVNNKLDAMEIEEIFPEFSYFFSTAYLHHHLPSLKEIYLVYTIRNDTYLQSEYQHFFNQTYSYNNLFFSIYNFQDSEKITHPFNKIKKEEWKSNQQVMKAKIEGGDDVYLYKYCSSAQGGLFSWFSNDQTKQVQFDKWNRIDYNLLILKNIYKNSRLHISFSYGENDCDYVDIMNTQFKDITIIHDTKSEEIQKLFKLQQKESKSQNNAKNNQLVSLTQENNLSEYGRSIGKFGKVVFLNMHVILCCMLISIQMKYYEPTSLQDAPSHISIVCNNLTKIILCQGLAVFSVLQLQKLLFKDDMREQQNFSNNNIQPAEYYASSFLTSFIITFGTISTYIISQFIFQVISFFSYLVCSLLKYILLKSSIFQRLIQNKYFYFFNSLTLLMPLVFLTNYHLKWVFLFVVYWILLGVLQANQQQYGHSLNILHGFAYLVFLYFILNIHNLLAGQIYLNSEKSFKNLIFTEEFTNEFFTMVCWFFILTRIENLVSSLRNPLQIVFILLSLFLFFFLFQSVSFANDYLCNLSYLLMFFTIYYHNYKAPSVSSYPQQQQQQQ